MISMRLPLISVVLVCGLSVAAHKIRAEPFGADGGVTLKQGPYRMGPDIPPVLITNNLTSTDEFRLTFRIRPYQKAEKWSSLIRLTNNTYDQGPDGSRMPAFLIEGNSTHLASYMGGPDWANVECRRDDVHTGIAVPDLEVNKTSEVMVRLLGDTFVTYIDRVMVCLQHRFHRRYRSVVNVSVWLGDEFYPPAPVVISNLLYAVIQNPGSVNLTINETVQTSEVRGADQLFLNISMGLAMELDRIRLEAEDVDHNLSTSLDVIQWVQGNEENYDHDLGLASAVVGTSQAKLKHLTSDLQEQDEALQSAKVRGQQEVREIEEGIEALAPQIDAMDTVLATLVESIDPGSPAAQVVGMMKQIKDDMDHRKAALEEELPIKEQDMRDVVKSRLAALQATEADYSRQSLHYVREFARLQELKALSSTTAKLRQPWREAEQNVVVADTKVLHFIDWIPHLQEHVDGDVRVGRELVQRILDRFKDNGTSISREDILENETESLGWGLMGPEGVEGQYGEGLGPQPPGYNHDKFIQEAAPHSVTSQARRQVNLLRHVQSGSATPPSPERHLARLSLGAASSNASSHPARTSLVSASVTEVLRQLPKSYQAVTKLGDAFAVGAAAALVRRGASQLGSTGMRRLSEEVGTVPKSEAVTLLSSLRAEMLKRDEEEAKTEKEEQRKCKNRQLLALGEKKRARMSHHQLLMQNASLSGEVRSISARLRMIDAHLDNITDFLVVAPDIEMRRPLKNGTLRKYMMQDVADIRKGILRWKAHEIAHPATLGGINTVCGRVVDSIRQVQDESRDLLDVVDDHLRIVRRVMKASEREAAEERDELEPQLPEKEEELERVGRKLEAAEQALVDADEEVAESEASCGSVQLLVGRRSEEEALVNAALELLGGLSGDGSVQKGII